MEGLPPSPPQVLLAVPHRVERQISEPNSSLLTVPQSGSCFLVKQHSDPQGIAPSSGLRQLSQPPPAFHVQLVPTMSTPDLSTRAPSPSVVVLPDHVSNVSESKSSPSLRVRTEELRRASSSPQECSLRSNHCPVLRPGPALGCNYCWNTIDNRGRILRRKTKYYCPECQTNLCIVPCFQSYHERVPTGSKLLPKTGSI